MKILKFTAATLTLALAGMGAAHAELSGSDKKFLERAAESGMLEIETSKLAAQRATMPEVKQFAEMMVADHTKVDGELKALAASKQFTLPAEQPRKVRSKVEDLSKEQGMDFDKEYADDIADDAHEDAVELFEDASKKADDADVKAWAAKTLPALQAHWEKGKALQKQVETAAKNAK